MAKKDADIEFQKRMQICVDAVGNASALARAAGISNPVIGDYLSGASEPTRPRLVNIARAAGVSVEWLATGTGNKKVNDDSPFVAIPVLPTAGSSSGGLALEFDEIGDAFPLPRVWAERWRIKEKTHCVVWGVEGMEPTINPHDKLICHMKPLQMTGDGLYLVKHGDVHTVKRLQWLPDRIRAKSDDERFEDYDLPLDTNSIVGRIVLKIDLKRI